MTNKQFDNLIKNNEHKKILKEICKELGLKVKFINLSDKRKRIEISFKNQIMETLEGVKPEKDFKDISEAILPRIL